MGHNEYGDPFAGEIRGFCGEVAPPGWMTCDGQTLPVIEYRELYDAIGTRYGGEAGEWFALPDLRGRVPIGTGPAKPLGGTGGHETATLSMEQLAAHGHRLMATSGEAKTRDAVGSVPAQPKLKAVSVYSDLAPYRAMEGRGTSFVGAGQPHENLAASTCVNFIIAIDGHKKTDPLPKPTEHHDPSPIVGEIRPFAFGFEPRSFLPCDGRRLQISQHNALYRVLGDRFGPAGGGSFSLPDLRGRVPIHTGQGAGLTTRALGATAGANKVRVSTDQLPRHQHAVGASVEKASARDPAGLGFGEADGMNLYTGAGDDRVELAAEACVPVGASRPHQNMQPYLAISYTIAIQGIFPYPT